MNEEAMLKLSSLKDQDELYYLCYGSNLAIDRLRCYFSGKGNTELNVRERSNHLFIDDPNFYPKDNKMVMIKYPLFFAQKSSNWSNRGVAFLDKDKYAQGRETIGRAYKMSKKHFLHLWGCEGKSPMWYGHLLYLGELNGLKMFSFTNEIKLEHNKPDSTYFNVIKVGLDEMVANNELTKEDVDSYLKYLKTI